MQRDEKRDEQRDEIRVAIQSWLRERVELMA